MDDENKEKGIESLPIITMRQIEQIQNGEDVNFVAHKLPISIFEDAFGSDNKNLPLDLKEMIKEHKLEDIVEDYIQKVKDGEIDKNGKYVSEKNHSYSENVTDIQASENLNYTIEMASASDEEIEQFGLEYNETRDNFLKSIKFDSDEYIESRASNDKENTIDQNKQIDERA